MGTLERGCHKEFANNGWKTEPWTVEIGGLCAKPAQFDVNDLVKAIGGIEQRNYRHRCVEAWSMVVPWDGFPLAKLVAMAEPMAEAKFVQIHFVLRPAICPGQRSNDFPWPYTEGLSIDEAGYELAFLATGIYGKPLLNQNGAPIRLVSHGNMDSRVRNPSRNRVRRRSAEYLWNQMAPDEYGFYANVNPDVDHPRWSQKTERVIGGGFFSSRQPTLISMVTERKSLLFTRGWICARIFDRPGMSDEPVGQNCRPQTFRAFRAYRVGMWLLVVPGIHRHTWGEPVRKAPAPDRRNRHLDARRCPCAYAAGHPVSQLTARQRAQSSSPHDRGHRLHLRSLAFFLHILYEGDWDPLAAVFEAIYLVWLSGLTILVILALTSNQWSIRKLGGKNWKRLHRLAYVAAALLIYHQAIAGKGHWYIARWLFFTLVTLELARLAKTYLRLRSAPEPG